MVFGGLLVLTKGSAVAPFIYTVRYFSRQLMHILGLVNTSFNVRGEPIVCTPDDAFRCFMGTELDLLVVGNCVLIKD